MKRRRWTLAVPVNGWHEGLFGHRDEHGPTGEEGFKIGKHGLALGPLGIGGNRGHMRGENDVVEGLEAIRDGGLVLEYVERRASDGTCLQRIAQSRLVDGDAARNVDEVAARTKRGQHLLVDGTVV